MLYQIIAQFVHTKPDGTSVSTGAPTFYLRSDVQGITSCEQAVHVARRILDPLGIAAEMGIEIHLSVCDEDAIFGGEPGHSAHSAHPDSREGCSAAGCNSCGSNSACDHEDKK